MLFRNFDIDPDQVTIDDQVLFRPSYISVMQWVDYWSSEPVSQDDVDAEVEQAVKDATDDLEQKIADLESELDDAKERIRDMEYERWEQ